MWYIGITRPKCSETFVAASELTPTLLTQPNPIPMTRVVYLGKLLHSITKLLLAQDV